VAASEDRMGAQPAPQVALLGLFQDETWQGDYDDVPVYGNGALHEPYGKIQSTWEGGAHANAPGLPTPCRVV
jgi:hypothetical protein